MAHAQSLMRRIVAHGKIYQFVEYVLLGIHFENDKKLLISCIYRSPSAIPPPHA